MPEDKKGAKKENLHMSGLTNIAICKENQKIISENAYRLDRCQTKFIHSQTKHQAVKVLSPKLIREIERTDIPHGSGCEIEVVNAGSLAYRTDLVMNFANPVNPGGGYLFGAAAQEECLCRESTLYASLSSKAAGEMYLANRNNEDMFDTDYMLLSPCVEVFRNADLELLPEPYTVAVLTIAAPNLYGKAGMVGQKDTDRYMKKRIRQFLKCGAYYGYKTATLGAWGCGAFGHDAKRVAGYFKEILIKEGYQKYYDKIIFAVYDISLEQYNYQCFETAFQTFAR